jgi:hypothetical protein
LYCFEGRKLLYLPFFLSVWLLWERSERVGVRDGKKDAKTKRRLQSPQATTGEGYMGVTGTQVKLVSWAH